jgi:hypothetical protein
LLTVALRFAGRAMSGPRPCQRKLRKLRKSSAPDSSRIFCIFRIERDAWECVGVVAARL